MTAVHAPEELGLRRRIQRLADETGVIAGLALDHRDSFRTTVRDRIGRDLRDPLLRTLKRHLAAALAPHASAMMLDEELGREALRAGVLPANVGLLMPLEEQGYEALGDDPITTFLPHFGPLHASQWGADACKLLIPYRPDRTRAASCQEATIRSAAAACHDLGLPLLVEPVVYRLRDESLESFRHSLPALLIESVERVSVLGVDVLKLQFPLLDGDTLSGAAQQDAQLVCERMDAATRGIPWVVLGGTAAPADFEVRLRIACSAGASGFLVGRPLWKQALAADIHTVEEITLRRCVPILKKWHQIARSRAAPVVERLARRDPA